MNLAIAHQSGEIAPVTISELDITAYAKKTTISRRSDLNVWARWCRDNGREPWPIETTTLIEFINAQGEIKKLATVRRYLSTLSWLLTSQGVENIAKSQIVIKTLKALAIKIGSAQKQAVPLTPEIVGGLAHDTNSLIGLRNAALLAVQFDLLARKSEIVNLDVECVSFLYNGGASILIRRSKTDQTGQGRLLAIRPAAADLLKKWLKRAEIKSGAVFRAIDKYGNISPKRLSMAGFDYIIKNAAGKEFSGHSARVGMAQQLLRHKFSIAEIMNLGRWKSAEMVARYTANIAVTQSPIFRLPD